MEQVIKIEVLGESFKFKSDANRDDLKEILRYLKTELHKVEKQFPPHALKTSKTAILVMTALNISKQYVELSNSHMDLKETVSARASKLEEMIEDH